MIAAVVVPGWGAAANEVSRVAVDLLPFDPYPGTLNVNLSAVAEWPAPPAGAIPWFGGRQAWWHGTVDHVRCVVLGVAEHMPEGHKLELLAETHLRTSLGLTDGDSVTVDLKETPE